MKSRKIGNTNIRTDGKARELCSYNDLPEKAKEDFDYMTFEEHDSDAWRFVKYKDAWHDVFDMTQVNPSGNNPVDELGGWDVYSPQTFGSGFVFKFADQDHDRVICGWYWITEDA